MTPFGTAEDEAVTKESKDEAPECLFSFPASIGYEIICQW